MAVEPLRLFGAWSVSCCPCGQSNIWGTVCLVHGDAATSRGNNFGNNGQRLYQHERDDFK